MARISFEAQLARNNALGTDEIKYITTTTCTTYFTMQSIEFRCEA